MSAKVEHERNAWPSNAWQRALTFGAVVFAGSVTGAAMTIANALLPQMQGDLSASLDQISWIVTASVVATAVGTPPTPWLAARFGSKQLLVASITSFSIASVMIGFATTLEEVVLWRVVQALTGAPVMVLSQTITLATYTGERRALVLAIWSIGLTVGWTVAPTAGAYLADLHTWRWAFFVLAPFGLLAIIACVAFVPSSERDSKLEFDWLGFIMLSLVLTSVQIVLNRGQRLDWFDSAVIVAWTVAGVAALYLFVIRSLTTSKPFFNWNVFRDRNLSVGVILVFAFAFVSLTPIILVPTMLERLRGLDVITIGQLLLPRGGIQLIVLLLLAPLIGRVDSRYLIAIGFITYAVGSWIMSNYNLDIGLWDILVPMTLMGLASSIIWLPVFNMMYATLDPRYRPEAAALVGIGYNISSSVGVAVSVTVLMRTSQTSNEELSAHVIPTNELLRFPQYAAWDLGALDGLAAIQAEVTQQALMIGYVNIYWMLTVVCIAALPIVILIGGGKRKD